MKKKYIYIFIILVLICTLYITLSIINQEGKKDNIVTDNIIIDKDGDKDDDVNKGKDTTDNELDNIINNITTRPLGDSKEDIVSESHSKVIRKEYEELRKEYNNDDIVGYLKIEGTSIDYIVTQTEDNLFYLDNDIYKNKDLAGWIFLDSENDIFFKDRHTVIYGHNMKKDIMFHSIRNYISKDFYEEHRYITFNTACEDNTWEIFSFYKTDTDFRYTQIIFPTQDDFYSLVCEMKSKSIYDTEVEVLPNDRILTLSTCVGDDDDNRYVINAKLITDIGE